MKKKLLLGMSLLLLLGAGLVGCQNATTNTPGADAVVGSWTLSPHTITFTANNAWSVLNNTTAATAGTGTWSKAGSTYTLAQVTPSASTLTATISGTALSITQGSSTQVYTRN